MTPAGELKRGHRVVVDGVAYSVVDIHQQTATARGSGTLVRLRLRNLRTGQLIDHALKATERLPEPDFEMRPVQFLYAEGTEAFHFMEQANYEQFSLSAAQITDQVGYLLPNAELRAMFLDGLCIGIELPLSVELTVTRTEPGARGDTVSKVTKPAEMETGIEVAVPLFVDQGDKIVVDTRDGRYLRRA